MLFRSLPPITLSAFLLLGCSAAKETPAQAPPRPEAFAGCPLGVPGTVVVAEETADGIDLTFTTRGFTDELRARAREAAAMHGPGARQGIGHGGHHGEGGHHGLMGLQLPPARATVDDVEGGARLHLIPSDGADRDVLVRKAKERVKDMTAASCR